MENELDEFEEYLASCNWDKSLLHQKYKQLRDSGKIGPKLIRGEAIRVGPAEPPHIPARLKELKETLKLLIGCYEECETGPVETRLFDAIELVTQAIARLSLVDFAEPVPQITDIGPVLPEPPKPDIVTAR